MAHCPLLRLTERFGDQNFCSLRHLVAHCVRLAEALAFDQRLVDLHQKRLVGRKGCSAICWHTVHQGLVERPLTVPTGSPETSSQGQVRCQIGCVAEAASVGRTVTAWPSLKLRLKQSVSCRAKRSSAPVRLSTQDSRSDPPAEYAVGVSLRTPSAASEARGLHDELSSVGKCLGGFLAQFGFDYRIGSIL
jgi:hypothetical protein